MPTRKFCRESEDVTTPSDQAAVKSAQEWKPRVADHNKLSVQKESTFILRRIVPTTLIGPVEELCIFYLGEHGGIDVKIPSTEDHSSTVRVTACTKSIQNCRVVQDGENPVTRIYNVTKRATTEGHLMHVHVL